MSLVIVMLKTPGLMPSGPVWLICPCLKQGEWFQSARPRSHTHMYVHGGLGGRRSPIWPIWAKTEEGMLTQRKTGMLFPQERKWTHSRKITNRHDLSWGPNAKCLTLGYNIFLEAKGEEVILFPLPRASHPERSLAWGQEEDKRCSSMAVVWSPT